MSYSFSVRGKTGEELVAEVEKQLDGIVANQPIHAKDREAASDAVSQLSDLVELEEGKVLQASVSGSIVWVADDVVRSVSLQVSVSQDTGG